MGDTIPVSYFFRRGKCGTCRPFAILGAMTAAAATVIAPAMLTALVTAMRSPPLPPFRDPERRAGSPISRLSGQRIDLGDLAGQTHGGDGESGLDLRGEEGQLELLDHPTELFDRGPLGFDIGGQTGSR